MISFTQYYYFLLTSHTIISIFGFWNIDNLYNYYETPTSYFCLCGLIISLLTYFILDLYYMYSYYIKKYDEYILHHKLFLFCAFITLTSGNISFIRFVLTICAITEVSSIILDIDGLYKLRRNPSIIPLYNNDEKDMILIYIKIIFLMVFLSIRYFVNGYYIYILFSLPWSIYEITILMINISCYAIMHIFWFYKIIIYLKNKLILN